MKILYVSASSLCDNSANSVHVSRVVDALAEQSEVICIAKKSKNFTVEGFKRYYSIQNKIDLKLFGSGAASLLDRAGFYIYACILITLNKGRVYTRSPLIYFFSRLAFKKAILELHYLPLSRSFSCYLLRLIKRIKDPKIVVISYALKKDLCEKYSFDYRAVTVLPDGADEASSESVIGITKPVVGYVGSFNKGKGVDLIARASILLPEVKFLVVGGSIEQILELKEKYMLGTNIAFSGYLRHSEVQAMLDFIDVCVLPNSKAVYTSGDRKARLDIGKYTSPLKLFEYMAHKKVILASDLPVIREVVSDKEVVFFESGNLHSLVKSLEKVFDDFESYTSLAESALKRFISEYTWSVRARKIEQLLLNL